LSQLSRIADSYRARLIAGYVLVAAVFAIAWAWSLYGPLQQAALHQQQTNLTAVARAASLYAAETTGSPQEVVKRLVADTDVRVTIVAADGTVLGDSENNPATMENHRNRPEIAAALAGRVGTDNRTSATEGVPQLYVAVPATLGGQRVALRVSRSLSELDSIAQTSRNLGLWLLLAALVIALAIATWTSGAASRPIRELSTAAARMAGGNLAVEMPPVPADLEALARALETLRRQMRSRLDALEAEQRTLRTALDGLSDAVFLLDGDVIRYTNGAADRIFRTPAAGWRDGTIDSVGLPASLSSVICSRLGSAGPYAAELEPDPLGTTLRLLVVPLEPGAETPRTLAVVSDVTERARLDKIRRDFVANASHELKTPVAGIQLLGESAQTAAHDGDVEQSLEFTRQIEAEAARLKRLVGDLLDLSRLESAPAPDAIADVRQAVNNAVAGHRGAAGRSGLTLGIDLSAIQGQDVFVTAEPTDVAIALDNLLDNAIAYTESGSVKIAVHASETDVRIEVSDTGPGIAAEHLPRIFERFYRVDRARSRESGGTGLGLSLVRHVVERSGGSVTVSSEAGVGTTFRIRLQRAR
jgi:two-component system, OmpR family, phosphate regulon sensor histidine kinase PhoR